MKISFDNVIRDACQASRNYSAGVINDYEFSVKMLHLLFYSQDESEKRSCLDSISTTQKSILRGFAAGYFYGNEYRPHPVLPNIQTDADIKEAADRDQPLWENLHDWLIGHC